MLTDKITRLFGKKKTKEDLDAHYDQMEKLELEKNDFLAMMIAAFITFVPVILIILAILFGALWLFFMR